MLMDNHTRNNKPLSLMKGFKFIERVGTARFELATPCSQSRMD